MQRYQVTINFEANSHTTAKELRQLMLEAFCNQPAELCKPIEEGSGLYQINTNELLDEVI